jgi:protein-disulfide isomerase
MKKLSILSVLPVLATLIIGFPQPGFPQGGDDIKALIKEVEALREGQSAIQKELQELKTLLQGARQAAARPPEPQNVVLSIDGAPSVGNGDAKVTLIEFSDYQCPFCGRHFSQTLPRLMTEYVKTGKVKYVLRDFPLESIHPQAFKAAEAARCAGDQGKYWEMHDQLFGNQQALGPQDLPRHAEAVGVDVTRFQQCLEKETHAAKIRQDLNDGEKAGVRGTPMFFLGLTDPNGSQVRALRAVNGAQSYPAFKAAIDSLLTSQ